MKDQRLSMRCKWVCWMLVLSIFFTQTRCVSYRTANIQHREIQSNNYFNQNLSKYRILVDDGVRFYELQNAQMSSDHFTGDLLPIGKEDYNNLRYTTKYKEKRQFKNCIFISTDHELLPMSASLGSDPLAPKSTITYNSITKVNGYVVDDGETFLRTFLIVILCVVVFMFVLLIVTVKSAADNGSGSNSDSNSGDSGSGESGEGSADSGDASGNSSGGN